MDYYTNVKVWGSKILYRGIKNGKRIRSKVEYQPALYVKSQKPTNFKTIYGEYVDEVLPGNMKDCRDFVKTYEHVAGFTIYGNQRYEYAFISDCFDGDIIWDLDDLVVANLDIEVGSENGFPDPDRADEPITAITIKMGDKFIAYGCGEFTPDRPDVTYYRCRDEVDLIKRFLDLWISNYPDIITGWNVKFFDIPYIVNRVTKLLGEDVAESLSPWKNLEHRTAIINGRENKTYTPSGIAVLDYYELYRKFAGGGASQESYKLDHIAFVELGERKLSYEEVGTLHKLYKLDFPKFMRYNIRDVELVEKLEDKLKLIELALTLAYDSKTNYDDVFTQVRMWDALTYNKLKKKNVVVPPTVLREKEAYDGAYVKDPQIGRHRFVGSFDLRSEYPSLIMQYNISPETLIDPKDYTDAHRAILMQGVSIERMLHQQLDLSALAELNCTLTPNGQFFRKDIRGFLPEMMNDMMGDRGRYKDLMIAAEKEKEKTGDKLLEKTIARYNNLQQAKKVSLNSCYGALGNEFFRFFDVRQASAITYGGKLSIQWVVKHFNIYLNKRLNTTDVDYVIASDTDSMYVSFEGLVMQGILKDNPQATTEEIIKYMDKISVEELRPEIDRIFQELADYTNAYEQQMIMKRELLCDIGIWTAKKRYILNVWNKEGVAYAKPKVKISGLEAIKSSTPAACRAKIKEGLNIILNKTEDEMIAFIKDFREEFKKLPVNEIAFPRGVNGLEKYAGEGDAIFGKKTPIHVRGSLVHNYFLKQFGAEKDYPPIKEGEKVKYLYLKEPNPLSSNIIAFSEILPAEFEVDDYIDYEVQYEKAFVVPLKIILDAIGWSTHKIVTFEDIMRVKNG